MTTKTLNRGSRRMARNQGLLGVGLICAAIVCAALILKQNRPAIQAEMISQPIVGEFDVVSVPVPVELVPAGTKARNIRFRTVQFPKHQVPTGALTSLDSVSDSVTVASLPANLPLFAQNFTQAGAGSNPVVESIPPGMRAMTVRVDATAAVEGWAGSGSVVDVLMVEKDRTIVVAEKVKILSAERSVSPVEGAAAPSVPSTITLLVTQEQCLAINTAIPRGKIAFALRSSRDDENWADTVFTAEMLKGLPTLTQRKAVINGYVAFKDKDEKQSFALADGKWTKTQVIPEGFLVASRNDATISQEVHDEEAKRSTPE